ncbi:hypothetical protein CBR64_20440 [Cellulosimicrobium cellulans]|uniref:HTH cro/C1-type domain-containing protein n=1 Tax=Cellulosimicrobium cellulans TaxID=1710 RepID=A0A1Y0I0W5_CELCE|nr:helix-turn-helix transcriptional regulator [Cellulosimicrobium cellulans]ARU53446.1 hypothetical protein CBR64_20440 [Cellulosimicrobium cellulans]
MNRDEVIGRNVRAFREARGLSQAQVADGMTAAGVEGFYPQTVLKTEKGQRSLKFFEGFALASVLGIEPVELWEAPAAALKQARNRQRLIDAWRNAEGHRAALSESAVQFEFARQMLEKEVRYLDHVEVDEETRKRVEQARPLVATSVEDVVDSALQHPEVYLGNSTSADLGLEVETLEVLPTETPLAGQDVPVRREPSAEERRRDGERQEAP